MKLGRDRTVGAGPGLAVLLLFVAACGSGSTPGSDPGGPTATPADPPTPMATPIPAPTPVDPAACAADPAWVTDPSFPDEVTPLAECSFHQFSWQDFLALTQPTESGALLFETYMTKDGVFDPSAYDVEQGDEPFPWGADLPTPAGCPEDGASVHGLIQLGVPFEAGANAAPLADREGRWLHYGIRMNEAAYHYVTSCDLYKIGCFDEGVAAETVSFPDQSVLIKTSWRIVDERELERDPPRYHITRALVDPLGPTPAESGCRSVWAALVGFHIVHKTPEHPEWVWATFEHQDVAPDCADIGEEPDGGWLLYDSDCTGERCTENRFNNPCATNTCSDITSFQCGLSLDETCEEVETCDASELCGGCYDATCEGAPIPTQACRDFPASWTLDDDGNGTVQPTTATLNANIHQILVDQSSVWQNYRLIGSLGCGPIGGAAPGDLQCSVTGPLQDAHQAGGLALSNMTMETYNQRLNCFSCHSGAFDSSDADFPQADFSHLFADMTTDGDCGETAASCPAH